jgi:glutamate--cysteine ligase
MPIESIQPMKQLSPAEPIRTATDFVRFFAGGGKPLAEWATGVEVELFGFTRDALDRIDLEQVQAVMRGFASETISQHSEGGYVTELMLAGGGRITLEPGGQIEFSDAHRRSLAEIDRAMRDYFGRLAEVGAELRVIFAATGFDPLRRMDEQNWIPKKRYDIMRPYLAKRGRRAWDMMCRTAATQVNLDYSDLADLSKKFALANRLAPVAAAIFANSPFEEGRLSGYKSTRYGVWLDTDPDRTGPSPLALEDDFSLDRFLDYVASVPMFFIRRDGRYIDLTGRPFSEFIADGSEHAPIFQDFTDHLSTIFTEARLKPHIEQRSMDCNSAEMNLAALAFWKGLMYEGETLDRALAIAPRMRLSAFGELQTEVARHGLSAAVNGFSVIKSAEAAIELARAGLEATAPDEARYLDVLDELVIKQRICPADILIRNFQGSWHGDVRKVIEYLGIQNPESKI